MAAQRHLQRLTLGWEPQWILIKDRSALGNWQIFDNMRGFIAVDGNTDTKNAKSKHLLTQKELLRDAFVYPPGFGHINCGVLKLRPTSTSPSDAGR
jgi:hypothetical protein